MIQYFTFILRVTHWISLIYYFVNCNIFASKFQLVTSQKYVISLKKTFNLLFYLCWVSADFLQHSSQDF